MSYASILVHVEADPAAERRLALAADLANQFDAALIGVGAEIFEPPTAAMAMGYADAESLAAEAEAVQEDLKLAESKFMQAARVVRGDAEWRSGVDVPQDALVHQARAADLIVAGPRRPEPFNMHSHAGPGDLIMQSGRPVLIAPPDLGRLDASSIVIAWKDTREARRAVADAMPFLERARQVLIAEVCETRGQAESKTRVSDVADYLARHGVKAQVAVRRPGPGGAAEALLEIADMQEAGLIVAGGYGHARLREWVFGGVTEAFLTGCRKAVLLSH
jgi:nucleotide-binding universal stress UspA family protein